MTGDGLLARVDAAAARATTRVGGLAMAWRSWGAGPPLVLLHGASGSWAHWIRNVTPLAERFRVLALDMPGFGDSESPPEPHTAEGLADLVAAGIDAVLPPPTECDLAGFSFGGIIGGLVAARPGSRIRRLVVLGAGGLGVGAFSPPALLRVEPAMTAAEIREVHRENLRRLLLGRPGSADDLAVTIQIENLKRARFRSGGIPESDVLRRALPAISARIAGVWGARDAFMGDRIEEIRRVLLAAHPEADLRVVEGAGHWVPYEAADRVNALLQGWLGRDAP